MSNVGRPFASTEPARPHAAAAGSIVHETPELPAAALGEAPSRTDVRHCAARRARSIGANGSISSSRLSARSRKVSTRSAPETGRVLVHAARVLVEALEHPAVRRLEPGVVRKKSACPKTWAITSFCSMTLLERTR